MLLRWLFSFVLFCFSFAGFAQTCKQYSASNPAVGWVSSAAAAAAGDVGPWNCAGAGSYTIYVRSVVSVSETSFTFMPGYCGYIGQDPGFTPPWPNGTISQRDGPCDDPDAACRPKAGQDTIVNFTVGFARTPDSADLDIVGTVNQFPASGELCYKGCKVGATIGGPGVTAWRSQTPTAQGLYRLSMDLPAVQLGTACTADGGSSAPLRPDLPSPTCPGFVGEVNGKPGCYGTADSPVNVVPADRPPVAPVAGNPAAGEKPASGEGSGTGSAGRTPTTGNGGNAGGPASAAVGGPGGGAGGTAASNAGTKPTEDGKEQVACGAPGQPKCGIDESGTPKDYTGKDGLAEWKAAVDSNRAQIKDSGGGVFDGFAVFFSAPPVASCSPFDLPNDYGSLDPCPVVDGVRGVMGYIWALGALFLCIGWIREAI